MKAHLAQLDLIGDAVDSDFVRVHFISQALKREMPFICIENWPSEREDFTLGTQIVKQSSKMSTRILAEVDGCLVYAHISDGGVLFQVAGASEQDAEAVLARLLEEYPRTEATDDTVPITFWSWSVRGVSSRTRSLSVPTWSDVEDNYNEQAHRQLDAMMDGSFRPSVGGQLVLWMGPPGTGKTWALRALAWEWRKWARFHYIVDPEQFFGEQADYMLQVLLEHSEPESGEDERWKVLLFEDTGELLAQDAKQKTGQALSRLLNVVDGIIGQGLRVLCLVTTNDEIKSLHPAVARPGRCAARVEFEPFTAQEAEEWLQRRGVEKSPDGRSLADLFALESGYANKNEKKLVGFGS